MKRTFQLVCLLFLLSCFFCQGAIAYKDMNFDEVRTAAEKGDAAAQTKLGVAYSTGINVEIDKEEAFKWYKKAADQGYATGQWNLAFMYIRGEGVDADDKKARALFQSAAEQGFAPAEYDLGMMFLYGMGGKRSRVEALKWVRRSADQGYREAIGFLRSQGELNKDKKKKKEGTAPKQHTQ